MEQIAFEHLPGAPNRFLLLRPKFVKVPPKFLDCAVLVIHASGGVSFSAVSIDTNRCWLKSSNASMKSCGISADSRMRCTRRSRSDLGKASISLNICSAVISILTLAELFISSKRSQSSANIYPLNTHFPSLGSARRGSDAFPFRRQAGKIVGQSGQIAIDRDGAAGRRVS